MRCKTMSIALAGAIASAAVVGGMAVKRNHDQHVRMAFARPRDVPYPADNPLTQAKLTLGKELFFDTAFSGSRTISCGTCHRPDLAWGDGRARAKGEDPKPLALRSPTLIDVAWTERLGWDGKFRNLEAVAFAPITAPKNMNLSEAALLARLNESSSYPAEFAAAFDDGQINRRNIELALATFERSIVAAPSPFDAWIDGDDAAMDDSAKRGFGLFIGKANCAACHSGWNFTDGSFHDIGTAVGTDIGRGRLFPTSEKLRFAFKTPTLRDVGMRPPYMHDGSVPTLAAVVDLYDKGGIERPSRSELIHPLGLTRDEKRDLVAFLNSLTGEPPQGGLAASAN